MGTYNEALTDESSEQDQTIPESSDASIDDAKALTWLRVIAWTVGGLLGFVITWPIVLWLAPDAMRPLTALVYVATPGGILGGIILGWYVGRRNIARRLKIAGVVLIAYLGLLIGLTSLFVAALFGSY